MMPNGDPRDGFFYPTLTLMMDSYIMCSTCLCVIQIFKILAIASVAVQADVIYMHIHGPQCEKNPTLLHVTSLCIHVV